jgi:anti-anti-sigma factor
MNLTAEFYGPSLVLKSKGELTEDTLSAFREGVEHHVADNDIRDVVIELSQVPFVDSAGLAYLLDLQDRMAERMGQVRLAGADENVRKILEMTRLDKDFETFAEAADAVKAASS